MIDPNEAPEGYRAEPLKSQNPDSCEGCVFDDSPGCLGVFCAGDRRKDGCEVIFVKYTGTVMATVPLNYGSMGEEVGP